MHPGKKEREEERGDASLIKDENSVSVVTHFMCIPDKKILIR